MTQTPYGVVDTVEKSTAATVVLSLDYPSRVLITKLVVRQESGTGAFEVDLFDRNPDDFSASVPEENYKVIDAQEGSSGVMEYWPAFPRPFFNKDGNTDDGNQRMIYVRIGGVATGTFHVTLDSYSAF